MSLEIPSTTNRKLKFEHGEAIGMSQRWQKGQYCSILTPAGIVGCGIYDLKTAAEFDQAIAIAKGTPANPLVEPEDLFNAKIVGTTPKAASYGIQVGMTGKQAVELMLKAAPPAEPIGVKTIDHVTLVVADLERSAAFYVDLLGMRRVERPVFGFPGLWFQAGNTQIHLIVQHEKSSPAGLPDAPPQAGAGRVFHFAFEVADCATAVERLKMAGVRVRGTGLRPDGCHQVWCYDPDGHVVELFSRNGQP
jgi:glyoxylase I family protein